MFINNIIQGASGAPASQAVIAYVSGNLGGDLRLISSSGERTAAVFAPYGYAYCPEENSTVLAIELGEECVCVGGAMQGAQTLLPGEVSISNAKGAIKLLQNGDVLINSIRFTKDGRVLRPNGEEI